MPTFRTVCLTILTALAAGCASAPGLEQRYAVCSYDTLWDATVETLKDRPVKVKDKEKGLIETGWMEVPVSGRLYGAFRREMKDAKDRTRLVVTVKRLDDVTKVSLAETRETWAFRGGSRLFGWQSAEPSEEEMAAIMRRLSARLKERGCSLT
jgi:hypothetical protein